MTDKTAQRTAVREQNTVEKADRAIKNDRCISAPVEAVIWDQYMRTILRTIEREKVDSLLPGEKMNICSKFLKCARDQRRAILQNRKYQNSGCTKP